MIDYVKKSSLSDDSCNEKAMSESTEKENSDDLNKTLEAIIEPLKVFTLETRKYYRSNSVILNYLFSA